MVDMASSGTVVARSRWVASAPVVAGTLVAAIGLLGLVGTWAGWTSPGTTVRTDVAVGLVGGGLSLLLHRVSVRAARAAALVPLVAGGWHLLDSVTDGVPSLHGLLTEGTVAATDQHAVTAVMLMAFALARLLSGSTRRGVRVLGAVAATTFTAVALTVATGVVFGAEEVGLMTATARFPAATALVLVVLLVGLFACHPESPPLSLLLEQGLVGTLSRRLLPAVVLAPPALVQLHDTVEERGVVDGDLGLALLTAAMVVLLAGVVGATAASLRRLEAEQRVLSRELQAIFTSMPAVVAMTDPDSVYLRVSPMVEQLLGMAPGSLRGRNARDFYPPEIRDELIAQEERTRAEGVTTMHEYRTTLGGIEREWEMTRFPVTDESGETIGVGSFALEITARKNAERTAAAAQRRLLGYLDAAPDATIIVDGDGLIRYANHRVAELLGYDHGELVGRPVDQLVPADIRPSHKDLRQAYMSHPAHREMGSGQELHALRRDGTTIPIEISLGPVETDDGTWIAAALRDVTERRAADLALREAEQRARHLADHDPLTGVANRRRFENELARHLEGPHAREGGLLIVDIDHFKQINDTAGHAAGDTMLIDLTLLIAGCLSDGAGISRIGGDEFAVIVPRGTPADIGALADAIVQSVRSAVCRLGLATPPTVSVGAAPCAALPDGGIDSNALLMAADEALYDAKAGGRDRSVVWSAADR